MRFNYKNPPRLGDLIGRPQQTEIYLVVKIEPLGKKDQTYELILINMETNELEYRGFMCDYDYTSWEILQRLD